jgi:serine/threonine-protein kinase
MSNPYAISRKLPPVGHQTTTDLSVNDCSKSASTAQKLRCKLARLFGSGPPTEEIAPLLRRRLRLATAITVAVFAAYLVRNIILLGDPHGPTPLGLAVQCLVVAVMVLVGTLLWSTLPFRVGALRLMELAVFGVAAVYFIYLHFATFTHGDVVHWATEEHKADVAGMATKLASMRWFVLIVLYGTFIPNTWRRCALVVGLLAAIPLVLNLWMICTCPIMGPISGPSPVVDALIFLGLGSAIAIFGSYKISTLQQEAVVARELGQYRLKQKLGAGGMGEVYLGEHVMLRRKCAVKLIRPDQAGDPTNLLRFEREVQAMAKLTHWNTVEVYDYGHAEDGTFYYVMEYLPGLSLQDLVDKYGPVPPERAIHYLRQICSALQEAHAVGLIHRDIKPSNVIACERGGVHDVAKLLDFGLVQGLGLSQDASKLTVQGIILGSPPYMAPEQALGRPNLNSHTDIYSVGAVAYFLLTGQPPFVRETAMELLVAHAHEKPTPLADLRPDVPEDLQGVIMRCLEKDPARRFANSDELEQALGQCGAADLWTRSAASRWWRESVGSASSSGVRALV